MDPTSLWCTLSPKLTVERRIATAVSNQHERERIIAMKAYEAFCLRGFEHGSDLDDWLNAERALSPCADDIAVTQSDGGFDISLAARAEQEHIVLHIAPSSLLILWSGAETNSSEQNTDLHRSTFSLASLPEVIDPARAEVAYRDNRVWVHLPYGHNGHLPSEPYTPDRSRVRRARRK
jgi:Protein of unknown function (DUF2934)